jgi:hypothetical protein
MKSRASIMGPIVCTRKLVGELGDKRRVTATVRIGTPRKQGQNWVCAFDVSGIGLRQPVLAYGVDGVQALVMALSGIRATIDKSDVSWSWVHGQKGYTGFPSFVPMGFGVAFTRKLERLMDREVTRFARAAERRSKSRSG